MTEPTEPTRMMGATAIVEDPPVRKGTKLVRVPRALHPKYAAMPWAEVLAAAERGDDGLEITDTKNFGFSYFRKGDRGGMLADRPTLFFQGWIKF